MRQRGGWGPARPATRGGARWSSTPARASGRSQGGHDEAEGGKLHTDLASAELCAALADGLGVDPRMLAGRLALLLDLEDDSGKTIAGLRDRGYTVTIDGMKAIS